MTNYPSDIFIYWENTSNTIIITWNLREESALSFLFNMFQFGQKSASDNGNPLTGIRLLKMPPNLKWSWVYIPVESWGQIPRFSYPESQGSFACSPKAQCPVVRATVESWLMKLPRKQNEDERFQISDADKNAYCQLCCPLHQNLLYMTSFKPYPSPFTVPATIEKSDAQKGQLTQRWSHSQKHHCRALSSSVAWNQRDAVCLCFLGRTIGSQSCATPRGCTAFPSSWASSATRCFGCSIKRGAFGPREARTRW